MTGPLLAMCVKRFLIRPTLSAWIADAVGLVGVYVRAVFYFITIAKVSVVRSLTFFYPDPSIIAALHPLNTIFSLIIPAFRNSRTCNLPTIIDTLLGSRPVFVSLVSSVGFPASHTLSETFFPPFSPVTESLSMTARVLPVSRRRIAAIAAPPPPNASLTVSVLQTLRPAHCKLVVAAWSDNGQYLAIGLQHGPVLLFVVPQQHHQQSQQHQQHQLPSQSMNGLISLPNNNTTTATTTHANHSTALLTTATTPMTSTPAISSNSTPSSTVASTKPLRPSALRTFKGHTGDVLDLQFSQTQFLASASMDRTIRLWHPHTAHCVRVLTHPDMVTAVSFHPQDDDLVLSGGCDGQTRIWRLSDETVCGVADAGAVISAATFTSPCHACIGTYDGRVLVADIPSSVDAVRTLPEGNQCVTPLRTIEKGFVRRPRARRKHGHRDKVRGVVATNHSDRAIAIFDGRLSIVALEGGDEIRVSGIRLRTGVNRKEVAFVGPSLSPDESFLIVGGAEQTVRVADLRQMRLWTRDGGSTVVSRSRVDNSTAVQTVSMNGPSAPVVQNDARRKDRDVVAPVLQWSIADNGVSVTCASFAPKAAVARCALVPPSDGSATDVALAVVGGDDGSVRVVAVFYSR